MSERRLGGAMLAAASAVVILLLALVVWASLRSADQSIAPGRKAVTTSVVAAPASVVQTAHLDLRWTAPARLLAPVWTGVVQRVDIRVGDTISTGRSVGRIGGLTRLIGITPEPFGRQLSPDTTGPDVAMLNSLLGQLGLPSAAGGVFDDATARGVRRLAVLLGAAETDVFEPSWLLFAPPTAEGRPLSSIGLEVGAPAPPPGSLVATASGHLAAGFLVGEAPATGDVPGVTGGAGPAPVDDPTAPPDELLSVRAGSSIGWTDQTLAVDSATLTDAELIAVERGVAPGTHSLSVDLSRSVPSEAVVVPPSAVVATGAGLCVVGDRPVPVEVLGESSGGVVVVGPLRPGDLVQLSPSASARSRCASK